MLPLEAKHTEKTRNDIGQEGGEKKDKDQELVPDTTGSSSSGMSELEKLRQQKR